MADPAGHVKGCREFQHARFAYVGPLPPGSTEQACWGCNAMPHLQMRTGTGGMQVVHVCSWQGWPWVSMVSDCCLLWGSKHGIDARSLGSKGAY